MKRRRKSKYVHLLRAMRSGDTFYLSAPAIRFDRHISGAFYRYGGIASTANFMAVTQGNPQAQHILRITCIKAMGKAK